MSDSTGTGTDSNQATVPKPVIFELNKTKYTLTQDGNKICVEAKSNEGGSKSQHQEQQQEQHKEQQQEQNGGKRRRTRKPKMNKKKSLKKMTKRELIQLLKK